jgi:tricorn protease-like protein
MQPVWVGGQLYFVSDRTDFWNIYTETADGKVRQDVAPEVWLGDVLLLT